MSWRCFHVMIWNIFHHFKLEIALSIFFCSFKWWKILIIQYVLIEIKKITNYPWLTPSLFKLMTGISWENTKLFSSSYQIALLRLVSIWALLIHVDYDNELMRNNWFWLRGPTMENSGTGLINQYSLKSQVLLAITMEIVDSPCYYISWFIGAGRCNEPLPDRSNMSGSRTLCHNDVHTTGSIFLTDKISKCLVSNWAKYE